MRAHELPHALPGSARRHVHRAGRERLPIRNPGSSQADAQLAAAIEEAVHTRLTFRCKVELIPEEAFGASGYKTNLTVTRR